MGTAKMINQFDFIHSIMFYMDSLPVCPSSAVFTQPGTQLITLDGSREGPKKLSTYFPVVESINAHLLKCCT